MDLTVHAIQWNGTGVPPIDLVVDTGGIVIGVDASSGPSATFTQTVPDGTDVEISVTQSGYHSYSMTIDNVYDEDKTVYIMMSPIITDINDPNYNRPNPMFFYFQDPCSFTVDLYNASSFPGTIIWYINNVEYTRNNPAPNISFCGPGEYQAKIRATTCDANGNPLWDRQWANTDEPSYVVPGQQLGQGETGNVIAGDIQPIDAYLDLDTATNVTEVEYRPGFDLEVSSPVNQLEDACCYTKDEQVTVTANVTLTRPGSVATDYTINWIVTDPDGLTVIDETTTVAAGQVSFQLSKLGVYPVQATLVDNHCGNEYPQSVEIETCNFIVLDYVDCNTYTIANRSSATNVVYIVESIDGQVIVENQALGQGESQTIGLQLPSLYFVNVSYTRDEEDILETYVLNNYCVIETCLSEYILDILCEDTRRCNPCPDNTELNQFLLLFYTYFMELNKEYGLNNFYTGLDESQLERLGNIKQVMDRILEFCNRRSCNTAFDHNARSAGSEPYDWAGKGSNGNKSCNCNPTPSAGYYNPTKPGYCGTCDGKI